MFYGLAQYEHAYFVQELVAVVGIYLYRDGLGHIKGANAQHALAVHYVTAYSEIHIEGVAAGDIREKLGVFKETELYVYDLHFRTFRSSIFNSKHNNTSIILSFKKKKRDTTKLTVIKHKLKRIQYVHNILGG